ncbi:MAG: DUF4124 domain-containing protein [Gammaproteobacteria bacterium]|nr:DUF4124 domain-containing protein [Gammaproteobacteria bacterium]
MYTLFAANKPIFSVTFALLGLLIAGFYSPESAAKIYQWVDENGKKHFSQTPPPDNKHKKTIIDTSASSSSIRPEKRTDGTYCGDLQVAYNKELSYNRKSQKRLAGKVSRWEKSLKQAEKRLNDYIKRTNETRVIRNGESTLRNSSSYIANKQKYTKTVNQYRCALGWAKNKSNPEIQTLEEKYLKAKEDYAIARKQQQEICGAEPADYNKYGTQRDIYKGWEKCQRKYDDVVRRTKNKLRQAEQEYRNTK